MNLEQEGWATVPACLPQATLHALGASAFSESDAGRRCLLDQEAVNQTARALRAKLVDAGILPVTAVAIQAIAFDKNPSVNWKVPWHQDLMFPFAGRTTAPGYELPTVKAGVHYARPPLEVLEELLAVRLHLDECDATNGPLRVAAGSHRHGILKSELIPDILGKSREITCLAKTGDALLMKPLLLHASSPATSPGHRRVLHYVFHSGRPLPEPWHRSI